MTKSELKAVVKVLAHKAVESQQQLTQDERVMYLAMASLGISTAALIYVNKSVKKMERKIKNCERKIKKIEAKM